MGVFGSLMPDMPAQPQEPGIPANVMAALAAKLIGTQSQRLPAAPQYDQATEQAAMMPETFANPMVKGAIEGMATLPRRAIENSQYSLDSGTYDPGPTLEAAMLPMGTGAIAGVPVRAGEAVLGAGPIRAYHGSPHDFDKFDLSKIGTGEGAQAYGHGLYFAENEATAKAYREALAGQTQNPARNQRMSELAAEMSKYERPGSYRQYTDPRGFEAAKEYDALMQARAADKGHMYEVNIHADPEHFLDWDKPLRGQRAAEVMRDVAPKPNWFQRQMEDMPVIRHELATNPESSGATAYGALSRMVGQDKATAALRESGIPGIKYLDQGSRAAGEGSRNYVLFNDKLIDILKKYGIAGLPAGAGAASNFGSLAPQEKM
jgi:hypothetical protein